MDTMVKRYLDALGSSISNIANANTEAELVDNINASQGNFKNLLNFLETNEVISSEDQRLLIESLKEELSEERDNRKHLIEDLNVNHQNEVIRLKAEIKNHLDTIKALEAEDANMLTSEVNGLTANELLGTLKHIETMLEVNTNKVENVDNLTKNMNLILNATNKTTGKLNSNVSGLVEILKVYVKNVDQHKEISTRVAKESKETQEKVLEVQEDYKGYKEDLKLMGEKYEEIEGTIEEQGDDIVTLKEDVKEVKGFFAKIKGMFSK